MIVHADSLQWLPTLEADSCAFCVTDPPYDLGFMGKHWDRQGVGFRADTWAAVLRVLKPGAHLLAFGGTRTYHRLVCAIEDAGFEIRDTIAWLYGQGFPKSLNLTGERRGWGTALKPAMELICLARKPLSEKNVAENVLRWGTGAINVDGCRVPLYLAARDARDTPGNGNYGFARRVLGKKNPVQMARIGPGASVRHHGSGRWPANVVMDEEAGAMLDEQAGDRPNPGSPGRQLWYTTKAGVVGNAPPEGPQGPLYFDSGGASRFFYCPKASRREREAGCEDLQSPATPPRNHHPTVKPVALMRWLVRLVTPPGGVVLDPFAGSGTTCIAAGLEGFGFLACEREAEYVEIAEARIAHWLGLLDAPDPAPVNQ